MNEEARTLDSSIEELYNLVMDKPRKVYDIFKDFFGEDKVDMQNCSLEELKHWLGEASLQSYLQASVPDGYTRLEWINIVEKPITEAPKDVLEKIVLPRLIATNVVNRIGRMAFTDIFILVHFPHVRITNENDKFVDISHLYAKINIMCDGCINGRFTLNRSEYSVLHLAENYMHSHVSCIPTHDFKSFQPPCLGSGPIIDTISNLNREYDEDIWNLFCLELSRYVTVESISGVPYHYLEKLGTSSRSVGDNQFAVYNTPYYTTYFSIAETKDFMRHLIESKKLKFNYKNGSFSIGMSYIDYMVLVSNEFISWYNDKFNKKELKATFNQLKGTLLLSCIIANNKIYVDPRDADFSRYSEHIGKKVCDFKGKEVTIQLTEAIVNREENQTLLLNKQAALFILNCIIKVLNYRYGRSKAIHTDNQLGTEVKYL